MDEQYVHPYTRLTIPELFVAACTGEYQYFVDHDSGLETINQLAAVNELAQRADQEAVFQLASTYLRSPLLIERARALDVLGLLGRESDQGRPCRDLSGALVIPHLKHEDELSVFAAAWALSNLEDQWLKQSSSRIDITPTLTCAKKRSGPWPGVRTLKE